MGVYHHVKNRIEFTKMSDLAEPVFDPKTPQTPLLSTYQTSRPHVLRWPPLLVSAIRDRRSHRQARLARREHCVSNRHHYEASPC